MVNDVTPLPPVAAAREEIGQVILNLLLNAVDAAGSGGTVVLTTAAEGDRVEFRVRDSGPGVPPEARDRIFNPFFTTKKHGVGLGLAISHKIATRHDGSLSFHSPPGGGATFTLRLPVHRANGGECLADR